MAHRKVHREDLVLPDLSYEIVGCAYEVYNTVGSGHPEKYYQKALSLSLKKARLSFQEQVYYPLEFEGEVIGRNYLDFVIKKQVVVEIKKDGRFSKSNIDQVLRYLAVTKMKLALLINFGIDGVKVKRIINFKQVELNKGGQNEE